MRRVETTGAFRRDLKRERKGKHRKTVDALIAGVVGLLQQDKPLPAANRNHHLAGQGTGYLDCHLKPDLVLIYCLPDAVILRLVRLGAHSELFG